MNDKKHKDDLVDEATEESFPASDPPSFMGGAAVAGPPRKDTTPESDAEENPRGSKREDRDLSR